MTVQDHVAVVSSLVAVVRVVQRLVHVPDEVNDKLQGFGLGCPVCVGVSQHVEKLLSLADHTIAVGTFARQVNFRVSQETPDVPIVSRNGQNGAAEIIDSAELATRWRVPESWIRNRTRNRTPKEERIPCLRFGRYVRFEWGSPQLAEWLEKKRQ
jgi:hypothetical protein